jgi:hypothetical protein
MSLLCKKGNVTQSSKLVATQFSISVGRASPRAVFAWLCPIPLAASQAVQVANAGASKSEIQMTKYEMRSAEF